MRHALAEHWITYLALPVLSIILYLASLGAVLRRRWIRHFPWFSAYVAAFLVSVTAVYIDFLLEFSSGDTSASNVSILVLSVVFYWILLRGPERLVKLPA